MGNPRRLFGLGLALALAACGNAKTSDGDTPDDVSPVEAGARGEVPGERGQSAPEAAQPALGNPATEAARAEAARVAQRTPFELEAAFAQAGAEFGVPAELLKALSYAETGWQMVQGEAEFDGVPPAFGLMGLRGERLEQGAALAGVGVERVRGEPLANVRAAAALLSQWADESGLDRARLGAWAPAVARYGGVDDAQAQAEYVHRDVYGALREGRAAFTPSGAVAATLSPADVEADFASAAPPETNAAGIDYGPSIWRPSPNFNSRPAGANGKPSMVIIHSCEGSYASCWSWLANSASQVSAHYVVRENGAEISQLVAESNRAWHIGATYNCSLNSSTLCSLNGTSSNNFTIGIEHGGFASQSSWPTAQIEASAKLVCDISKDRGIARDRFHIVGHGQLQPATRTDPGKNWPWTDYINRINANCGGGGGGGGSSAIIVDSNSANNDPSKARIEVSSTWTASTSVGGFYGTGYFFNTTEPVSDGATFWFYLPAAATKTIDAWWTAASDRSTSTPFVAFDSNGTKLGTVNVNQQGNGGRWNTLGTFAFKAGWNRVVVSRWTGADGVVIADAVQVR
ncbi:MAG: N-acetylmuramoyl-L-alanine amidase [Polyangiaceae bacterium]|nr:N-acetylmuramoyl-L-alanine amidase [Polyangiaceae bacterium]